MGLFWKYFKNTLAWPLIRVPGVLAAVMEGASDGLDQARNDILWLRDQFNPATCESQYVEHFARARGLVRHRLETDTKFRARVVRAYAWQVQGGRTDGIINILSYYGYTVLRVENLRDDDPERWAEFRVIIEPPGGGYGQEEYELMVWAILDQKPARSILASVRSEYDTGMSLYLGGMVIARPSILVLPFTFEIYVPDSWNYAGGMVVARPIITILAYEDVAQSGVATFEDTDAVIWQDSDSVIWENT